MAASSIHLQKLAHNANFCNPNTKPQANGSCAYRFEPRTSGLLIKSFSCRKISLRIEVEGSMRVSLYEAAQAGQTVTSGIGCGAWAANVGCCFATSCEGQAGILRGKKTGRPKAFLQVFTTCARCRPHQRTPTATFALLRWCGRAAAVVGFFESRPVAAPRSLAAKKWFRQPSPLHGDDAVSHFFLRQGVSVAPCGRSSKPCREEVVPAAIPASR